MTVEIMDTTLRDGEQTSGVSFSTAEKMTITRLLLYELHVPRIEVASARVSDGELDTVGKICAWASGIGRLEAIEVLGFLDGGQSVDWITRAGGRVINLLAKGSERHCRLQLGQTPARHFERVAAEVNRATAAGLKVNLYLEDWSNGMKQSRDYVFAMMDALRHLPVERFMLPDTLGVLNPYDTLSYVHDMVKRYPGVRFDFHAHNDYDLATANVFAAVKGGARGVHCTVNGLGERAGNTALEEVVMAIKCHNNLDFETGIDSRQIIATSKLVSNLMRMPVQPNKAIVGRNAFAHSSGIHQDGVLKSRETYEIIDPEDVGVDQSSIVLTARSGRAALKHHLAEIGYTPENDELDEIYQKFLDLADKKKMVTTRDLEVLVGTAATRRRMSIQLTGLQVVCGKSSIPTATVQISFDGDTFTETACGNGPVDAAITAVKNITKRRVHIEEYLVQAITRGSDDLGKVHIQISHKGKMYHGFGANTDIVTASVESFIDAISKIA